MNTSEPRFSTITAPIFPYRLPPRFDLDLPYLSVSATRFHTISINPQPVAMYRVGAIPGSGLGLIATSAILRGTLIAAESPLILVPCPLGGSEITMDEVERKVNELTEDEQRAYFSLHSQNEEQGSCARDIFTSNFQVLYAPERGLLRIPDSIALFLVCARLNHSCSPSACVSWNTTLSQQVVYAIKDIQPGEQITTTYLGNLLDSRDVRQRSLKESHQFTCLCEACSVPDSAPSDARRLELGRFGDESHAVKEPPAVQLGYCKRAFDLLRDEGLQGDIPHQVYLHALGICASQGDLARVSAFAVLAMDAMRVCHGANAVALKNIRPYVRHPETHNRVGSSRPWRTRTKNTQRKESSGFEVWLWSRAE